MVRSPTFYRALLCLVVAGGVVGVAVLIIFRVQEITENEATSKWGLFEELAIAADAGPCATVGK